MSRTLGVVVGGSLSEGVLVRLNNLVVIDRLAIGQLIVFEDPERLSNVRYVGEIVDIEGRSPYAILSAEGDMPGIAEVINADTLTLRVLVRLTLAPDNSVRRARDIPPHFSIARPPYEDEIALIANAQDQTSPSIVRVNTYEAGEVNMALPTQKLFERSVGIFGASGSGKSFLATMLLWDYIAKGRGNALVFDPHGDYGYGLRVQNGNRLPGLVDLLQATGRIVHFTVGNPKSGAASAQFKISYAEVEVEDIARLANMELLNLTQAQENALLKARDQMPNGEWLRFLVNSRRTRPEIVREQFANLVGDVHEGTVDALLRNLRDFLERIAPFMTTNPPEQTSCSAVLSALDKGKSAVVSFDDSQGLMLYAFVVNLLMNRVYRQYTERSGRRIEGLSGKTVVAVEEAHRFMSKGQSALGIFSKVAREMRKYNLVLLVIDQRPSEMDEDVISQLGTRVVLSMTNSQDLDAVCVNISEHEREIVLRESARPQSAVFEGHAVNMILATRVRDYREFLKEVQAR